MMRRSTWVILIVAVVLVAATLFWQNTRNNRESKFEAIPTQGAQLEFDFNAAQVTEVVIQNAAGDTVILARADDGSWVLIRPETDLTDSQAFENTLLQFLNLQTVSAISSQTSLSDLGLAEPAYRFLLRLDNGREAVVNVGKSTPTGSGYYVLDSGSDRAIYVIGKFNIDAMANLILQPPILIPTPTTMLEFSPETTSTP